MNISDNIIAKPGSQSDNLKQSSNSLDKQVDVVAEKHASASQDRSEDPKINTKVESENLKPQSSNDKQTPAAKEETKVSGVSNKNASDFSKEIENLDELISELKTAVNAGQLKQCISLYERCQAKINQLTDLGCPAKKISKTQRTLTNCYNDIRVLKDWRHWGTDLIRQDLINELVQLQDFKGEPKQLASELKQIRERWNSWNRTGDFPNKKLRNNFEQAYETAFDPCKRYFQEQKILRKTNKKIRKKICKELKTKYDEIDWSHAQWQEISVLIRDSRQRWKKAIPLNKKDWTSTNSRFDEVLSLYHPHLEKERQRGVQFRLELIEKVKQQDSQPVHVAIKNVKGYQKDWNKAIIRDKKSKEKQLWEQFKSACDKQFERRKQENIKRQIPIDSKKKLLDEIKQLNDSSSDNFSNELTVRVTQITKSWKDLSSHRSRGHESLDKKFAGELAKFQRSRRNAEKIQFNSQLSVLISKAEICDQIHALAGSGEDTTELASFTDQWNSIGDNCGPFEADIQHRYEHACNAATVNNEPTDDRESQYVENLNTRQRICLELEILFEIDSPPEFSQARLQRNVARLNESFKRSNNSDTEKDIHDLFAKYCVTGPVPQAERTLLAERFEKIRSHYFGNS